MNLVSRYFVNTFCFFICAGISILQSPDATAAKFIAVLVADTSEPGRTADRQATYQELLASTKAFAEYSGLDYSLNEFTGNNFNFSEVINAVSNVNCNNDDTIFFAYAGHGTSSGVSQYPSLYFRKDQKLVQFDYLVDKLRACQPRLLIALSGACNSWNARTDAIPAPVPDMPNSPNYQLYKKLFAYARGVIKSTASSPGELSWNTTHNIFLKAFTDTITSSLVNGRQDASWEGIMQDVKDRTIKMTKSFNPPQHPVSDINISYGHQVFTGEVPYPFTGQIVDGKPYGYGTLTYKNGAAITGNFINGVINGNGAYKSSVGLTLKDASFSNGTFLGLAVCNRIDRDLYFAIGYEENGDWLSDGWFPVPSMSCKYIKRGEINGYIYYRAMYPDREELLNGDTEFCTFDDKFFKRLKYDGNCSHGGEPKSYVELEINDGKGTILNIKKNTY